MHFVGSYCIIILQCLVLKKIEYIWEYQDVIRSSAAAWHVYAYLYCCVLKQGYPVQCLTTVHRPEHVSEVKIVFCPH